ncbi:GDP-6-deoxy-D-lyxo-4-hexulose reductase [Gammaproteobacteria bacterium]|nr:GDP-6-deoxy-D-lyxo-4-hexulose reductase [Gammaproteobacteria bacterium]
MKKRILLTGSNGFTGSYVKKELEMQGYEVQGLVQANPAANEYVCDITNPLEVNTLIERLRPDGLIHLAALSFVGHPDQQAFYKVNVFGTLNLLEGFKQANITPDKIIIASSANIYGMPDLELIPETTQPSPMNHYAMSKLAMEYMVKLWFNQFNIIITRPFNYTGVGQDEKFLVPKIVAHFKAKKPEIELGNINVYREFNDVRDVANVYVKLYESAVKSEIVNICSGRLYALKEIITMMEEIAGYSINIKINQKFVRDNEIERLGGDGSKLNKFIDNRSTTNLINTLNNMIK